MVKTMLTLIVALILFQGCATDEEIEAQKKADWERTCKLKAENDKWIEERERARRKAEDDLYWGSQKYR